MSSLYQVHQSSQNLTENREICNSYSGLHAKWTQVGSEVHRYEPEVRVALKGRSRHSRFLNMRTLLFAAKIQTK